MLALTKETAKYHCRTCLRKLNTECSKVENHCHSEKSDSNEFGQEDIKDFGINITINNELHYLLMNCTYKQLCMDNEHDVPQNVCIDCYDKLQDFDTFYKRALESAEKLRNIFSYSKDDANLEFQYIKKSQQNEKMISPGGICEPLDTLLEQGLMANNKLTTFNSIEVNDTVGFETSEISGSNTSQRRESAKESSDILEWKENAHHEDNIPINTIKIEIQSNEELDFSVSEGAIKTEFEYMDSEQPSERNIFYESLLKDTLTKSEAVLLGNNALASVEVHNKSPIDITTEKNNNNLQLNEHHVEDKSNTITFENNLKNSEISECESQTDMPFVENSLTNSSTDFDDRSLAQVAKETQSQNLRYQQCTDNSREKDCIKKERKEILQHKTIKKNNFKCVQCNHSFLRKINLDAHVRQVHEGNKRPFQCDRCDKSYSFIAGLYLHIKEVHETKMRSYKCDYPACGRIYANLRSMKDHKRKKHSGEISVKKHVWYQYDAKFMETCNVNEHRRNKNPPEAEKEEQSKAELPGKNPPAIAKDIGPVDTIESTVNNNLQTNECRRTNLNISDWKEHKEDTSSKPSDIIQVKNNLDYSEISEDKSHANMSIVEDSFINVSTGYEEHDLADFAMKTSNQNMQQQKCIDNLSEKHYPKKGMEKIHHHDSSKDNVFKCAQCNQSFERKVNLYAHVRKVHEGNKRPFQCDRCDKSYSFIGSLYEHIKEIHETEVRSYKCDYSGCGRIYTNVRAMKDHKRKKHGAKISENKHVLEPSDKSDTNNSHCTRLKETLESVALSYGCEYSGCGKIFSTFVAMEKHKELKHSVIEYVCDECGATFTKNFNLYRHWRAKHPMKAEMLSKERFKVKFKCKICNMNVYSRLGLKNHLLTFHSNDREYECYVCGLRLAEISLLVEHMLVHSNDKTPCEHCGKQFKHNHDLKKHIRAVHMKVKPYKCQYCFQCYASKNSLIYHEYIHTGDKPYGCDVCGKPFRQPSLLRKHRSLHENETK